jgi:hypothetical protein
LANARKHEFATIEHLLLALLDDSDASNVLRACDVNLNNLRERVSGYIDQDLEQLVLQSPKDAQPTTGFQRVIHRAVVHVQSNGSEEVTGANALVAIFAERKTWATFFLEEQGMTRFEAVQFISHGIAKTAMPPRSLESVRPHEPAVARKIFISYRRDDSSGHTGRVNDRLEKEFGRDLLFMDVDAIPLGVNFANYLKDEIAKCDAMLVIIGPDWLNARDENNLRRLDYPKDFVRIEISAALLRDIPVIPITVDGAKMPRPEVLPDEMKELALRNGLDVRHSSFHADMDKLVGTLRRRLGRSALE